MPVPKGMQFRSFDSNGISDPAFEAYDPSVKGDDKLVAAMWLHPETGEIQHVYTHDTHQRRGIATHLFRMAQIAHKFNPEGYPEPRHSPYRSDEGEAWAKSVGGELPEREDD